MPGKIFTPLNVVKFTNVSVVRYKKKGKKFELACYPNKVQDFRSGADTDLDNILQSRIIFTNVSKGIAGNKGDLQKVFGKVSEDEMITLILKEGDLQKATAERDAEGEQRYREICSIVAEKCVHAETGRRIPPTLIEKALKELGYVVKPGKSPKKLALDAIKLLVGSGHYPIQRAPMRICVKLVQADFDTYYPTLQPLLLSSLPPEPCPPFTSLLCTIHPSQYKEIETQVQSYPQSSLTVDTLHVYQDGEVSLDDLVAPPAHHSESSDDGDFL